MRGHNNKNGRRESPAAKMDNLTPDQGIDHLSSAPPHPDPEIWVVLNRERLEKWDALVDTIYFPTQAGRDGFMDYMMTTYPGTFKVSELFERFIGDRHQNAPVPGQQIFYGIDYAVLLPKENTLTGDREDDRKIQEDSDPEKTKSPGAAK